jgi:hypothetical protein
MLLLTSEVYGEGGEPAHAEHAEHAGHQTEQETEATDAHSFFKVWWHAATLFLLTLSMQHASHTTKSRS